MTVAMSIVFPNQRRNGASIVVLVDWSWTVLCSRLPKLCSVKCVGR